MLPGGSLRNSEFVKVSRHMSTIVIEPNVFYTLDEVAQLPGLIPARQQSIVIQGKPVPLWDTSRMLLLVVALLAAEWALRKRFKLL